MVRTTSNYNPELEAIGSEIVKRLGGVWKPGGAMCRCPAHADRSPSLSVRVGDHALLFKCFASCDSRDVINEILRLAENALHPTDPASQASSRSEGRRVGTDWVRTCRSRCARFH